MTTQTALAEVLAKFGTTDHRGVVFTKIPLHRTDYTDQLSAETVEILNSLPYAFDDSDEIKYSRRSVDQVVNLDVWK
jgi:hypothetical protein